MSDLDQLRVSLDEALRTISPMPAPVDAAVRRGKAIRARRRLTALAGIVAVAAVAGLAGYPAMTHKQLAPAPPPPLTHRPAANVTDVPPGPGAAPGTVAEGMVSGESWRVFTAKPGTDGLPSAPKGQQCFGASGPAIGPGPDPIAQCDSFPAPTAAMPVSFVGFSCGGPAEGGFGQVAADVRYVVVTLSDGTRLRLTPVSVDGKRYVAFAASGNLTVDSARAYLDNGQYLTAIPFDRPGNPLIIFFGMWQRQGQPVPARITRTISAEPAGKAWWATAYTGPWGTCLADISDSALMCIPTNVPLGTQVLLVASGNPRSVFGAAAGNVSYLRVTRTNGTPLRVRPVAVGNQKFFAFLLGIGQSIKRWTAYDAAGNPVASGTSPR